MHYLHLKFSFPLFFLWSIGLFAQETKMVVLKKTKETFSVLKSDKSVRHGSYQMAGLENKLLVKGQYDQGVKAGVWEYYGPVDGKLQQSYDHSKNKLIDYFPKDADAKSMAIVGKDTVQKRLSRPPLYLGGEAQLYRDLKVDYPVAALNMSVSGEVKVEFVIDELGKASEFRVRKGLGYGCDEEALRAVKSLPTTWIPAVSEGKDVKVLHTLPITYTIGY